MTQSYLNKIYNQHSNQLYYYALGITKSAEVSQEIMQDAFVKLWQLDSDIKSEYAFLRSSVKNACINYLRDKSVEDNKIKEYIENDKDVAELREELKECAERIKKILETLPPKCKDIFIRKYINGLKYREIAEDLGISTHTVKSQLKYASDKIKDKMDTSDPNLYLVFLFF